MKKVIDFFCGMGGLSYGFSKYFDVTGVDINKYSKKIFKKNKVGTVHEINLSNTTLNPHTGLLNSLEPIEFDFDADIIIGGPPCRPWSSVNITKRELKHPDYGLVESFLRIIDRKEPQFFLMENVPPLKNDSYYKRSILNLSRKYHIDRQIIKYSDYGAATKRKRLITYGFLDDNLGEFSNLLELEKRSKPQRTVREEIQRFEEIPKGNLNHIWPNLKTIHKYAEYYKTGKYGWYILKWDEPAPSFGNVMKTYTLHPEGKRAVSVREVMAIMGYPDSYQFPDNIGHTIMYQMVADTVSPCFSFVLAKIINKMRL
jgi:DNA (cytosine-5)-methyltransferase 1